MKSLDVADWFLQYAHERTGNDSISNMQLQKLVFLAESCFGSLYEQSLVEEPIQAWDHGPAVKPLYGRFKSSGDRPIPSPATRVALPDDVTEVLESIWDTFGSLTGWQLRSLTHRLGPYASHYLPNVKDIEIPKSEIHEAWQDFLAEGARLSGVITADQRTRMRTLLEVGRAAVAGEDDYDAELMLTDYREFART